MIAIESSWSVLPQAPNIIAPRHSGLTLMPVAPSLRCSIAIGASQLSRITGCFAAATSSRRRTGVVYGRLQRDLGVLGGLGEDRGDRLGEGVERLLGLGLGRLDHQRLVDQQREVDGRRVEAEVQQPLGEVERLDLQRPLHRAAGEDELVHAELAVGERQMLGDAQLPQPREQVVGVQHGGLGGVAQPVGAERADVGVGAHEAAVVAVEAAQPADRLLAVVSRARSCRPRAARRPARGR